MGRDKIKPLDNNSPLARVAPLRFIVKTVRIRCDNCKWVRDDIPESYAKNYTQCSECGSVAVAIEDDGQKKKRHNEPKPP